MSKNRVNFMLPEAFPCIFLLNESIVSQFILFYAIYFPASPTPPPPTQTLTPAFRE